MALTGNNKKLKRRRALRGIQDLLNYIDPNSEREGLQETPERVLRAWEQDWACGIFTKPPKIKVFEDGGENYDQMLIIKDIPIHSFCEHHLAPIWGTAVIGYIPTHGRILGLSKFTRVAQYYACRLQVQERLTNQIAKDLWERLHPQGLGVTLTCRHMCIESRGVKSADSTTITSALHGVFRTEIDTRTEFLRLGDH